MNIYNVTADINGTTYTVKVEAESATEAQEFFIEECEAKGQMFGDIYSIKRA